MRALATRTAMVPMSKESITWIDQVQARPTMSFGIDCSFCSVVVLLYFHTESGSHFEWHGRTHPPPLHAGKRYSALGRIELYECLLYLALLFMYSTFV